MEAEPKALPLQWAQAGLPADEQRPTTAASVLLRLPLNAPGKTRWFGFIGGFLFGSHAAEGRASSGGGRRTASVVLSFVKPGEPQPQGRKVSFLGPSVLNFGPEIF